MYHLNEKRAQNTMTVFAIKLLAMVTMVIDHLGWWLYMEHITSEGVYVLMRSVGRIAFPLFCFLLVSGFEHSRDRTKYLTRLTGFAIISQIPFVLVMTQANYVADTALYLSFSPPGIGYILLALVVGLLWYKSVRADCSAMLPVLALIMGMSTMKLGSIYLLRPDMNVLYTLAFSLAVIIVADKFMTGDWHRRREYMQAAALLCALLIIWDRADYGLNGMLLIVTLWLFRSTRWQQALMVLVWCLVCYPPAVAEPAYLIGAALSVLPLFLYNGRLGKSMKTAFYLVYPLHLSVLGIISLL